MSNDDADLWRHIQPEIRDQLEVKQYAPAGQTGKVRSIISRLSGEGALASEALWLARNAPEQFHDAWVPGMYVVPLTVHEMPGRGSFAEIARLGQGVFTLVPEGKQVSVSWMTRDKGGHLHPPLSETVVAAAPDLDTSSIAGGAWRVTCAGQWDVQLCGHGVARFTGVDTRVGFPPRRFSVICQGMDRASPDTCAVTFAPGILHHIEVLSPPPMQLIYFTSETFTPAYEGRVAASEVEGVSTHEQWRRAWRRQEGG